MKYSKFLILTLTINFLFYMQNVFAIDVLPEGKLIRNSEAISRHPTVQMYFNANRPPVINVTPGRPTLVQFPSEVRSCISGTALITVSYGDKISSQSSPLAASKSSSSSASQSGQESNWYSAVILNADGISISKMNSMNLLNTPSTNLSCQIRIPSQDSMRAESYAWKIVGIKIARPEDTHLVVYLLDENSPQNSNGLPSERELLESGEAYIDVHKINHFFKKNKSFIGNPKKENNAYGQKLILTENTNLDTDLNSNLNTKNPFFLKNYNFSQAKERPPSPKM